MKLIRKMACLLLSFVLVFCSVPMAAFADAQDNAKSSKLIGDVAVEKYRGKNRDSFIKISHPDKKASKKNFDPKKDSDKHKKEVFADGLLDYVPGGAVGIPNASRGANGQGDRGQTYSWAAFAYGDWMYVSTLYNSTASTGGLLGHPTDKKQMQEVYGGDMFVEQVDGQDSGSTLAKINVKTGQVKLLMAKSKNGLETSFRNAVEYNGKLYFCGSVNHLPSIFEIDPKTDAFQCVYQDPSMRTYPGGPGAAWKEARKRQICPTIRGLSVFKDHLVISTVGMDGNPYIAISDNPTSGEFKQIAWTWKDKKHTVPGELFGYPACKIPDSIMGGSIWEMVEFNDKLYVAICTGTEDNAPDSEIKEDEDGNKRKVIKTMQSFALVSGECNGNPEDPDNWTWTPVVGDKKKDGAKYTFGIDPERERSGACNLVVFKDHLYIGEYNDTQISFANMMDGETDFLCRNMDQSVSLYRMDKKDNIEKVMGDSTRMFPRALSGINESGFGRRETQYIWQSRVFNGKLYLGTFDETTILYPIADMAMEQSSNSDKKEMSKNLNAVTEEAEQASKARSLSAEEQSVYSEILDEKEFFDTRKEAGTFADFSYAETDDPNVLLPEAAYDDSNLIEVNSPATLYLALQVENELMNVDQSNWSVQEKLAAKVRYTDQFKEIAAYIDSEPEDVPDSLMETAETFASPRARTNINNLSDVLKYLKDCIPGFDMYVSSDGKHFNEITREGLGDPYNQGLRAFASNDDPENPWMTVGTANPFYGTQIWRMDNSVKNMKPVDPAQSRVYVRFINKDNKVLKRGWDKAGEIYVNEGVKKVDANTLKMLVPEGYKIESGQTALSIKKVDGKNRLDIKVKAYKPVLELKTMADSGKTYLTWNKVDGAKSYEIYYAEGSGSSFKRLYRTGGTDLRHTSAKAGRSYSYKVRAVFADGTKSTFSSVKSKTCACPRLDVSIKNIESSGKIYLKWKKVSGAARYEVYSAKSENGTYSRIYSTASGDHVTHNSAKTGSTYYYKVRAITKDGTAGAFTSPVHRTCDCARPSLNVTLRNGKPYLKWTKVDGTKGYQVYCSVNGQGYKLLKTTKGTTLTHGSAKKGTTCKYRVRGICSNKYANGALSYTDTVKVTK